MEKKTLAALFSDQLFRIPDYQRGYAWEKKQWDDFIQDIDALVDEDVQNHYTGTIVIFQEQSSKPQNYGTTDKLKCVEVVDGQQRLTTCSLYLAIILKQLVDAGATEFTAKIPTFLYSGNSTRLTLNNDTNDLFFDLLSKGTTNTAPATVHQIRLLEAYEYLNTHITQEYNLRGIQGLQYLKNLFDALIRKLSFTFYRIEEECEIGMTFELMNSRGQGLSILELLKNYLMHWTSRNISSEQEKSDLTRRLNKNWKEVYTNIGISDGDEDQCVRVAWTLYWNHTPKYWSGYEGFKADWVIPLRGLDANRKVAIKKSIEGYSDYLAEVSQHYAVVIRPSKDNTISAAELGWLEKLHHAGNIASFLPLIVSARMSFISGKVKENKYVLLLQKIETYAYRVFLTEGRRSNAGMSSLYRWGNELSKNSVTVDEVVEGLDGLALYYSPNEQFLTNLDEPSYWYNNRRKLKYTLYEYELSLLKTEGKSKPSRLAWEDLSDSTIEHILPQNPEKGSKWLKDWKKADIKSLGHDIGNLVLTVHNSNYLNFEYSRKKGEMGSGICYANSDIRQERRIASFPIWVAASVMERRKEIVDWIKHRWEIEDLEVELPEDLAEEEQEE